MKKILLSAIVASFALLSCSPKFEVENTATESLAGNWMCTIFYSDTLDQELPIDSIVWIPYTGAEFITYNTADNVSTQMWINDQEVFWGTFCKIDCDANAKTFGKAGAEYTDEYNGVLQKIWGGKVTYDAAVAPGSGTKCDKIEFFIQFEDDQDALGNPDPFGTTYYVAGYRRTGFPEDDDEFVIVWDSMPEQ